MIVYGKAASKVQAYPQDKPFRKAEPTPQPVTLSEAACPERSRREEANPPRRHAGKPAARLAGRSPLPAFIRRWRRRRWPYRKAGGPGERTTASSPRWAGRRGQCGLWVRPASNPGP